MKHVSKLLTMLTERLDELAQSNAVVAKQVAVGKRRIIPLCELSMSFGGGGGAGEGTEDVAGQMSGKGTGGGAGGGTKVSPVAVIVVDNGKVRIEMLGL